MFSQSSNYSKQLFRGALFLLVISMLAACKTTESTGVRDYSNGINEAVAADGKNPAYTISENMGAAGYGYAYMLEKVDGRWRVMYDSYDAKAFAKPAGNFKEIPVNTEVLWTDGKNVVVYFGTESLTYSRADGSFACPTDKKIASHRACRSSFTETKSLLDGLKTSNDSRPFVLDFKTIKQAIAETVIVATAKRRMAREK